MKKYDGQSAAAESDSRTGHDGRTSGGAGFEGADALRRYLAEVSRYPRLTAEEESDLSSRVLTSGDPGTAHTLTLSHLSLVVKIAFRYRSAGYDMLDLIQEGNVGLLQAVRRYNPRAGAKFSSYASFWIRAYMMRHMMATRSLVTIGKTQVERKLFYGLGRETRLLEARGIAPTVDLLSRKLRSTEEDIMDMQIKLSGNVLSLEAPVGGADTNLLLGDTVADESDMEAEVNSRLEAGIFEAAMERFRDGLKPKARYILDHRILEEEPATLKEMGNALGVTRERVRQIERTVLTRLRQWLTREMKVLPSRQFAAYR